ncbi:hypothetical protein C6P45_000269 [Maudiozyma exigua]|uniref:alanine--glyoxylate transaminase n=1 Tax=Maudiozyma exigua TaxID=34358 RepID=A0A9P7B9I5_MAUEX|nr:hypothetical protein C6P45_000269 [Kazachstania exigua]
MSLHDQTKLLIPGPIKMSPEVIGALGQQSVSHTCPTFTDSFRDSLTKLRRVYGADSTKGIPLIISGSGTLGFDLVGSNLIDSKKDNVLVLSTGFFSDEFHEAISQYYVEDASKQVTRLGAPNAGATVSIDEIERELGSKQYDLIVMTHVDTSTGVLLDVESIANLVHKVSPDTLIAVDTVCSLGCETIEFDKWGLDICISASQKAIGAPPGLSLGMVSENALKKHESLSSKSGSYYTSFTKWLPILRSFESGKSAYFATPPVQMIDSLRIALTQILEYSFDNQTGIHARIAKHKQTSDNFKTAVVEQMKQELVSGSLNNSAHGLTAIYVKDPPSVIQYMAKHGYTITGGIHKDIKSKYIRVGHMGISACDDSLNDVSGCLQTLSEALKQ